LEGRKIATLDVHDALRDLIISGQLTPGQEISQHALSRELSVSRTPLREALRLLERDRLVTNAGPHRMVKISPMSMVDLDDLYCLRVLGEALALWLTVPGLRESDFDQMSRDADLALRAAPVDSFAAHARFHRTLRSGAAGRLSAHLENLFEHARRYQLSFITQVTEIRSTKWSEHAAIVDACRARDRVLARDLLVDHIASTALALMSTAGHTPLALPIAVTMAKAQ
jgi:DNA-binding GntR family transcriptional regulator